MVRHLHLLEDLDGDDVESRPSINESTVDDNVYHPKILSNFEGIFLLLF
jgi:hypothetical protein